MHSSHSSRHSLKCRNVLYHNLLRSETMVTPMTLMGLDVGVEYAQECLYSFFVTLICCMCQVQKYT